MLKHLEHQNQTLTNLNGSCFSRLCVLLFRRAPEGGNGGKTFWILKFDILFTRRMFFS